MKRSRVLLLRAAVATAAGLAAIRAFKMRRRKPISTKRSERFCDVANRLHNNWRMELSESQRALFDLAQEQRGRGRPPQAPSIIPAR